MNLTLGFSPCPNDTFIFDAIVNRRIDLEGLEFNVHLDDVQELNEKAFQSELDVTKVSYHASAFLLDQYAILSSGSALGRNCGPLLISKDMQQIDNIPTKTIAIPGKHTTAYLLLKFAFGEHLNISEMIFSDIEDAVIKEQVDLGLIIHENRFTYASKGLVKVMDMGVFWEEKTGLPIPLGSIMVRRNLPIDIQNKVNRVLRNSVLYAMENPNVALPYMTCHAQEMDTQVMQSHVKLYVNDYTIDLNADGRSAVRYLIEFVNPEAYLRWKNTLFVG
ncbi:MAG: 1,4-dihydroxy-6-naphthoate synthase [Saprospiraceae bacterium]